MADQQVVLITGTSRGIGRELVRHFLDRGCRVVGCSRKPPPDAPAGYTHHLVDVTDEGAVVGMVRAIAREHGRLDVLVINAGTAAMNLALTTPASTARRLLETNFTGAFLVSREAAKLMLRRRYGRIVNLSTVAVPLELEGEALYAASKSALVTFTRVLARELAPFGITCNLVGPGPIPTDLIAGVPPERLQELVNRLPLKEFSTVADVINAIDFFVKPESRAITGQVLYLGGA